MNVRKIVKVDPVPDPNLPVMVFFPFPIMLILSFFLLIFSNFKPLFDTFSDSGQRIPPKMASENSHKVLTEMKENNLSMVYVCKLQPRPGALNLRKCVEMGVPPGPLLGKLKNGEVITLPNGTTVCSKDVCEPDDPGPTFIGILLIVFEDVSGKFFIFSC